MDSIKLPMIKKIMPTISASDIIDIEDLPQLQPMVEYTGQVYSLKKSNKISFKQGELIHAFAYGYQRYYGTQFISVDLWYKIKIKGL